MDEQGESIYPGCDARGRRRDPAAAGALLPLLGRGFPTAGADPTGLAQLFTADGIWEVEGGGVRGRPAIAERLQAFGRFGFHLAVNGDIVVRGDAATARWHALVPAVDLHDGAIWTAGVYDTEIVRTADGWRFARVAFRPAFRSAFEVGWGDHAGV